MREDIYYLDTSALVKRYVYELGSDFIDEIYGRAYSGLASITFSYWNIAEAVVVFDKYEKRLGHDARRLLHSMLRETKTLIKLHRMSIIGISPQLIRKATKLILKHHIYVADALQIVSAKKANCTEFVTADKRLANIAEAEGLETIYLAASSNQ